LPVALKTGLSARTQLTVATSLARPAGDSVSFENVNVIGLLWTPPKKALLADLVG
jgi:hypothetical protein